MDFEELISANFFKRPFVQNKKLTFINYFNNKLDEYFGLLNKLNDEPLEIPGIRSKKATILDRQSELIEGLKVTLNYYLNGKPSEAFLTLSQTLELRLSKYTGLLKINEYEANEDFYRIRIINENNTIIPENFFHIPFEQRGKVANQRFSIQGFPSLYLGKTIYICWEELSRPNISEFQSIRLNSTSKLKYIDLAPPFLEKNLRQSKYYKYLMIWPLIFACTIKVRNKEDYFKPEYIIPQLLLEWIRLNEEIDGIRYWSTHVNENPFSFKGEFYNLVIPIKENKESGLCDQLCKKFKATEIVSWQALEFALGGATFIDDIEYNKKINAKMDYLELIKGRKYPYSYSVFGKIEQYLNGLETRKLINS